MSRLYSHALPGAANRTVAFLAAVVCASVLTTCTPGLDDEGYAPAPPPPPRPDTLPTAYAPVAGFCAPPDDPAGEPTAAADTMRPLPLGPGERVTGMRDMWFEVPMRCVVRDQEQLEQLWAFSQDSGAAPEVDFGARMLVVATAGQMGSSGYSLGISSVWQRADTAVVVIDEYWPGQGCMGDAQMVAPADAVAVPRTSAVRFSENFVWAERCL